MRRSAFLSTSFVVALFGGEALAQTLSQDLSGRAGRLTPNFGDDRQVLVPHLDGGGRILGFPGHVGVGAPMTLIDPAAVPATIVRQVCPDCFLGDAATRPVLVEISPNGRADAAPGTFRFRRLRDPVVAPGFVAVVNHLPVPVHLRAKWGAGDLVTLPPDRLEILAAGSESGTATVEYTVGAETLRLDLDVGRVNHLVLMDGKERLAVLGR